MYLNKANLRKLAQLTVSDGGISVKVEEYVLSRLTKSELRAYLFYLKREIAARKVFVRTPSEPDMETKERIKKLFAGQDVDINYETQRSLGAGIQIEYKDNLMELSLRKLISQTYDQLKERL